MTPAPALADEVPDIAGTIEGWRAWVVLARHGRFTLAGVVYKVAWPPGDALVATCLRRPGRLWARLRGRWPHDAPSEACTCGAYATDVDRAAAYLETELGEPRLRAFGTVALWGDVVECEHGWRASHAYPTSLYLATANARSRTAAADVAAGLGRYGVPVRVVDGDWNDAIELALAPRAA